MNNIDLAKKSVLRAADDLENYGLALLRGATHHKIEDDPAGSTRWLESIVRKLREIVSQDTEAGMASPPGEGEAKPVIKRFGAGEPETLNGFAEKYGLQILVKERSSSLNRDGRLSSGVKFTRYMASIRRQSDSAIVEVMENGMLGGKSGNGDTIEEATSDLARSLAGNRVAIGAYGPDRKNVDVPNDFRHEVKPPTSELGELRGKLATTELQRSTMVESYNELTALIPKFPDDENGGDLDPVGALEELIKSRDYWQRQAKRCGEDNCTISRQRGEADARATSAESALAASEQAREGMQAVVEAAQRWRQAKLRGLTNVVAHREALFATLVAFDALASPPAKEEAKRCGETATHGMGCDGLLQCSQNHASPYPLPHRFHAGECPKCGKPDYLDGVYKGRKPWEAPEPFPVPAAPPQAETGGEPTCRHCGEPKSRHRYEERGADFFYCIERLHQFRAGRTNEQLEADLCRLTSERDALRVQLEAAGAREAPINGATGKPLACAEQAEILLNALLPHERRPVLAMFCANCGEHASKACESSAGCSKDTPEDAKRLPDGAGWWARTGFAGGGVEWFEVHAVNDDGTGPTRLEILHHDRWEWDPVEKYTKPLTRWYGPFAIPGDES